MKHLIWCSDGTGNSPTTWTNVYWLYAMQRIAKDKRVTAGYDAGVGTWLGKLPAFVSLGFAAGLSKNVRDGYRFFSKHYKEGDKIYLFGFSRGAYTVRSLANFMSFCGGIIGNPNAEHSRFGEKVVNFKINILYLAYRWGNAFFTPGKIKTWLANKIQKRFVMRPFAIELLGVWDTVSSVGMPISKNWYHQVGVTKETKTTLHALALDEQRWSYKPILYHKYIFDKKSKKWKRQEFTLRKGQVLKEVWFPGVHSDVGGGFKEDMHKQLPHVSLNWMLSHLPGDSPLKQIPINRFDSLGKMNSASGLWKKLGLKPRRVCPGSTIHYSVLERCKNGKDHTGHSPYIPAPENVDKAGLEMSISNRGPFLIEDKGCVKTSKDKGGSAQPSNAEA